jgi:glyoxylase-like metal-dependent hydrolase (beta-lactamase superfamily II)
MKELFPGVFSWSWYSQEKQYDFNGHALISKEGRVLVDPPFLTEEDQAWMERHVPFKAILLTNRDHVRESDELRKQWGIPIWAPALDAPLMEIPVDDVYRDGGLLPGGLKAIHIPDNKSPGESALWLDRESGILILGDALIGVPAGQLSLMPPEKYSSVDRARAGLRVLLSHTFDKVLVGDGASVLRDGKKVFESFLSS